MLREFAQVIIAGADFNPGIRDADERLGKIFILQTRRPEHGARSRSTRAFDEFLTAQL
jgi:hypothetical protein